MIQNSEIKQTLTKSRSVGKKIISMKVYDKIWSLDEKIGKELEQLISIKPIYAEFFMQVSLVCAKC